MRHQSLNNGRDSHLTPPSYTRTQVVDHLVEGDDSDATQLKAASRPPDFSDLNFPSLTEGLKKSGSKKAKDIQIVDKNGKQPKAKSDAKKPDTEGKPNARTKQETHDDTKSIENFPDLEDTETYLFRSVGAKTLTLIFLDALHDALGL